MSEEFDLRAVARKVVEDYPHTVDSLDILVEVIEGRVPDAFLRDALRQCLRPLVEKVFEEFSSLPFSSVPPLSPAVHMLDTPCPNGGDHSRSDGQTFSVAPSDHVPSFPSGHLDPDPHAASAASSSPVAPVRRTKVSMVRSASQGWLEQQLRTEGGGVVALGSATFEDLMAATQARRRAAYVSMAKADTLERLAKLLKSSEVSIVSELPPRLLSSFISSNPEIG